MLLLPFEAITRLVNTNRVEVWTPALDAARTLTTSPADVIRDFEDLFEEPEPAMNVYHVVRRRHTGETITRARAIATRASTLQTMTPREAYDTGFRTRDEFYEWWEQRYLSKLSMGTVPCWVATYERIPDLPGLTLARPIPGKQGDYTASPLRAIDELESPDGQQWAERNDERRALETAQEKLLWRAARRKPKKDAA